MIYPQRVEHWAIPLGLSYIKTSHQVHRTCGHWGAMAASLTNIFSVAPRILPSDVLMIISLFCRQHYLSMAKGQSAGPKYM